MKRRTFSGLAAGALSRGLLKAFADGFDERWKLGIITDQVDLDLGFVLSRFYPKYRLRWAEIRYLKMDGERRYVYAESTAAQLKRTRRQLDDAGVRVSVLDTAIFKITLPGTSPVGESPAYVDAALSDFSLQLDYLKRAAAAAHALGTKRVRIFTFRRVARPAEIFDRVVEQLHRVLEVAREQDITLLVENEYDCNVGTGDEIVRLFKAIDDPRLMHNWDPCNAYEMDEQPYPKTWDELDHSRISHIHLKDARGKEWKPIGAGDIDFAGQFEALRRGKYLGTLSVETRYRNSRQDQFASSVESMDGLRRVLKKI